MVKNMEKTITNYELRTKIGVRDPKFKWRHAVTLTAVFALLLVLSNSSLLFGQQPQAPAGTPLYSVNAKYVNGMAPGYWPTAGTGLVLNLSSGTAYCGNPPVPVSYPGGSLALAASATNYIYLNPANNCSPAAGTSAFTAGEIPIARVVTGSSQITSITDARSWFQPQPCVTGSSGDLHCSSLGTNQNISLTPSGSGAVVVTNLEDKGGQVFNVKAYGAKGDGTTDDSPAFQAAYNTAAAAGGGTVFIPPAASCYLFDEPINMTENEGSSNSTKNVIVRGAAGGSPLGTSGSEICANTGGIVFDVTGSREITFEHVGVTSQSGVTNPSLVGLYAARDSNGAGAQAIHVINSSFKMVLHTSGTTYSSGAYLYGSELDYFAHDAFAADYPLVVSTSNVLSQHSAFISEFNSTTASNTDDEFYDMELDSSGLGPAVYFSGAHDMILTGHDFNFSAGSSYSSSLAHYAVAVTGTCWNLNINLRNEGYPGWGSVALSLYDSTFQGSHAPGGSPELHAVEFSDGSAVIANDTFRIIDEYPTSTTNYFYDSSGIAALDTVNFSCGSQSNCINIPVGSYQPGGWTLYSSDIKYSSSPINPNPSVIISGGTTLVHSFSNPFTTTSLPTASVAANSCNGGTVINNSQVTSNSTVLLNSTYWYGLTAAVGNVSNGNFTVFLCNPTTSSITPGSNTLLYRLIN